MSTTTIDGRNVTTLRRALSVYQAAVIADPDLAPDERHERLAMIADANAAIGHVYAETEVSA